MKRRSVRPVRLARIAIATLLFGRLTEVHPMSSSPMPLDHSLNSPQSRSTRPELERESDRLKLLLDMTTTLVSTLECRELLRTVSASIRRVMHFDLVGVWLPDVEHVHLRQTALDFPESKGFVKEDALQP